MKIALVAAIMLLAGCASSPSYAPAPAPDSRTATPESKPVNTYSRDIVECERQAALATTGSRGKALDSCMRARGHTPGR
jgi:hypothetical protein